MKLSSCTAQDLSDDETEKRMELEQMTLLKDMSLEYATWPSAMPEDISAEVLADVEKFGPS